VRDALDAVSLPVATTGAAHSEVLRHLANSGDVGVRALGASLANLRELRNHADYKVGARTQAFSQNTAARAVALGSAIVREIDEVRRRNRRLFIP
jgi:hypothetical protein